MTDTENNPPKIIIYEAEGAIAKNYLNAEELRALGQIVSGYLDFAERQAERHAPMTMRDWASHFDKKVKIS